MLNGIFFLRVGKSLKRFFYLDFLFFFVFSVYSGYKKYERTFCNRYKLNINSGFNGVEVLLALPETIKSQI